MTIYLSANQRGIMMAVAVVRNFRTPNMFLYLLILNLFTINFVGCKDIPQPEYILDQPTLITNQKPEHSTWNELLSKHVDSKGFVDYKGFKADEKLLVNYLQYLAEHLPQVNWTKNDSLAYYINAYNAQTVKLIIENYPLKSIKDIDDPWDQKRVQIGENIISLGELEHDILREMRDPRIHFAINCASFSCPKLNNQAYVATEIDSQLDQATSEFIMDSSKNKLKKSEVELSKIFRWYKSDFTENGSLIEYLNRYSTIKISEDAKIKFLDYDWSLNEMR